jgi:uncharacterized sulfatase
MGRACGRTVELLDLYPTLAELCGLAVPAGLEGRSLRPLLDDPAAPWDKPAFTQVWRGSFPGHSIRTERFRYTEWDGGRKGAQLSDYATDPDEKRNLVEDPAHARTVAELIDRLRAHWANEYRPPPEKPAEGAQTPTDPPPQSR